MHVSDLVRTRLARSEPLAAGRLAMAPFTCAKQPLLFHVAGERRIARDGADVGVLACERDEVVVMELKAPARMVSVLGCDGDGESRVDARVRTGMSVDSACECGEWVFGGAGDVPPSLDGLEREVR